jgi:N-acetylglucosamine-6-sulfatase
MAAVSRREFLETVGAGIVGSSLLSCARRTRSTDHEEVSPRPPNVVIILADDQRYDALHCTGHAFAETPHTDRLAAEGVLFSNAFASTPICAPNRACLFTGTFAHRHGNRNNGTVHALPPNDPRPPMPVPCFPALLRDAGYDTAFFGKWHAGERSYPDPGFRHFEPSSARYHNPPFWNGKEWVEHEGFLTDLVAEKAAAWIRNQEGGPFFVMVSHTAPHLPVMVPERYRNLYAGERPYRPPSEHDGCSDKSEFIQQARRWFGDMRQKGEWPSWAWPPPVTDEQHRNLMRLSRALDDSVETIRGALEETGQLDNTVFIYHSDNGFFLGEHGLSAKYYPYEEALRLPLIIRYPRSVQAGSSFDEPVYTLDLAPSILEWCGIPVPASMQGNSLAGILAGGRRNAWRGTALHEYFFHQGGFPPVIWLAARNERWKYMRFGRPFGEELYDLENDPYEMANLAGQTGYGERMNEMRTLLKNLVDDTGGDWIPRPTG